MVFVSAAGGAGVSRSALLCALGIAAAPGCISDPRGGEYCAGQECGTGDRGDAGLDAGDLDVSADGGSEERDGSIEPGQPPPELPDGPYVSHEITVDATRYFASTGLYVRPGDAVTIEASGSWTMQKGASEAHGPDGFPEFEYDGCPFGSLVASIGLEWTTGKKCVGEQATFEADRAGIVYLAPNDGILEDNEGTVTAEVKSATGVWAPVIEAAHVAAYDLTSIEAPWVELRSPEHVILTLPIEVLIDHQAKAARALATFDVWYEEHRVLAGAVPYGGQRIRFFPDPTIESFAFMLAGNPIRLVPGALDGPAGAYNILMVHDTRFQAWAFPHELGHDFSFINEGARYMVGPGPVEAWANLFTLYTLERLNHPEKDGPADRSAPCDAAERDAYLASGSYDTFRDDPWLPLCMLLELRDREGWELFEAFFADYNTSDLDGVPTTEATDAERWTWLRDTLDALASESTTPIFERYRVPLLD